MIVNALIIGCGNIGSQYDLKNNFVQTHSKSMFTSNWINNVDLFDLDTNTSIKIAKLYGFNVLEEFSESCLKKYDIVSICTPTNTHYQFLKACILKNVKLVICEKPISFSTKELNELLLLYNNGNTKVLVNYYRRFQKSYGSLKRIIAPFKHDLVSAKIQYYKGLLNYASHAFDIIHFISEDCLLIDGLSLQLRDYDYFEDDPTISATFESGGVKHTLVGQNTTKPILDIDLRFKNHRILLNKLGNTVLVYHNNRLIHTFENMIKNYMIDVLDHAKLLLLDYTKNDNFKESLELNKQLINII
ncbi:Gfo/Idh/MocA family oxidoreductase [Akkermansiaceae bacterium]|nr:Gfo/Idh/MocA family oxidoreductase [Akkermansiaceae bacterium]